MVFDWRFFTLSKTAFLNAYRIDFCPLFTTYFLKSVNISPIHSTSLWTCLPALFLPFSPPPLKCLEFDFIRDKHDKHTNGLLLLGNISIEPLECFMRTHKSRWQSLVIRINIYHILVIIWFGLNRASVFGVVRIFFPSRHFRFVIYKHTFNVLWPYR